MKSRVLLKKIVVVLSIAFAFILFTFIFLISNAKLEVSSGVHRKLVIPLFSKGSLNIPIYSGTGQDVFIPGFLDGPVVTKLGKNQWEARWFCQDQGHLQKGVSEYIDIACGNKVHRFFLTSPTPSNSFAPMPGRLVVMSDIEGNARFLRAALKKLKITDEEENWSFGSGHLVVLGDSVDRGRDVFAVLWHLYELSRQAEKAGGAVHLVLGNHEQYVLRSNISRAHPQHLYALNQMGGYEAAFAPGTVIGDWLRSQPVALMLGDTIFVHGGIAPRFAESSISLRELNDSSKAYWTKGNRAHQKNYQLDAVFEIDGLTQYRGYLMPIEDAYPVATSSQIETILKRFGASRIVVGHTPVKHVSKLYDGQVYAVNVNDDGAKPEVLFFENGNPIIINLGEPRMINSGEQIRYLDLNLFSASDRKVLVNAYREARRLATLPHPY